MTLPSYPIAAQRMCSSPSVPSCQNETRHVRNTRRKNGYGECGKLDIRVVLADLQKHAHVITMAFMNAVDTMQVPANGAKLRTDGNYIVAET